MAFYKLNKGRAEQIVPDVSRKVEKDVQSLVEANLEPIFGVRFVATEFQTGSRHRGRIDTLGLDQDGSAVIVEFKKATNPNVMNQGLFYLDWLLDHRGDFEIAARKVLGNDVEIQWSQPRLILLAEGFNRYDHHAVNRIDGRIELWTYTFYKDQYLRVERVEAEEANQKPKPPKAASAKSSPTYTIEQHLAKMSRESQDLFHALREQILALGEDISERYMNQYIGYRRQKNFVEVVGLRKGLNLFIDGPVDDPEKLGEDVSDIGHWGTGNLRIKVDDTTDMSKVMPLIQQAYDLQA